MFLNKWIIGFKPIKYTPFWWWYRLISHEGFRLDDYYVWKEFWFSLNHSWDNIEKETGGSTSQVIKLASFGDSLEKMNDAVTALQTLMGTEDGRNDPFLKSIAADLKKTFNTYRTHLRKNYPDQYAQIKGGLDEISSIGSDSGYISGGEGENHTGPSPRKSTYGAYTQAGFKKVSEGPGATFGPGPKAGPEGVVKNKYITDFKYKLVNKKKLNKAAKGIIVKPLWEANTDVEDYLQGLNINDPDKKKFIASRLLGFDELERKLNELIPLLQQSKHKTMDYYRSNPESFSVGKNIAVSQLSGSI